MELKLGVLAIGDHPESPAFMRAAGVLQGRRQKLQVEEDGDQEDAPTDTVSLRMRSAPFIEMLERCEQAGVEIVWGV